MLNSHTHYQVAQANPQAKTWQRVCLPNAQPKDNQDERKKPCTYLQEVIVLIKRTVD